MTVRSPYGLALAAFVLVTGVANAVEAETIRLALVVGGNRGQAGTAALRYAERDADRFAAVLLEVGQVTPDRIIVLRSPRGDQLRGALDRLESLAGDEAKRATR